MKRSALLKLFASAAALCFVLLAGMLLLAAGVQPAHAQGPAATPTVMSPEDVLRQAQAANDNATAAVNSANNAVNIVNSMLGFIQVAGILGGLLAALVATASAVLGFRTLNEYREDLKTARDELEQLKAELKAETERAAETVRGIETRMDKTVQGMEVRMDTEMGSMRGQVQKTTRALALLEMGEAQFESKNAKAALRTYTEAYELDPDNRATNYFLGELYIIEREIDHAIMHLEKALAGDETFAPAEAALGYALRLKGDRQTDPNERNRYYAQSEQQMIKALKIDPAVRDAAGESFQGVLGGLYQRQGRIDDSIRCYLEAEKVTPANSYPISNLGLLYFRQGDVEKASAYFTRAIALSAKRLESDPYDYWRRFDIATAESALSHPDKAIEQLDIALKQVQSLGPVESLLGGLNRLKAAPKPPQGIDTVIVRVEAAAARIIEQNKAYAAAKPA